MLLRLTASKDTYITNKIINSTTRATDANVGQAGTLDLFKLYNESNFSTLERPRELSRILVKFDMGPLRQAMNDSKVDINHSSFKCNMILKDVYGGQTTPKNYNIVTFPLSRSFDEGSGRDIKNFGDLDSCNYITASVLNSSASLWGSPGGMRSGSLKDPNIDVITSGALSRGIHDWPSSPISFSSFKKIEKGNEDFIVDVTNVVSGLVSNQIPDHGFLIALHKTQENDEKTYFVKRFASRNSTNPSLRPRIDVMYNDSMQDHTRNSYFNVKNSIFLTNRSRGEFANILSGSSLTEIKGHSCISLRLSTASWNRVFTGSQYSMAASSNPTDFRTGIYTASFNISQFDSGIVSGSTTLQDHIKSSGSIVFKSEWISTATIHEHTAWVYDSGSIIIKSPAREKSIRKNRRYLISITNLKSEYFNSQIARFRVFVEDIDKEIKFKKKPFENKSVLLYNMHFRIRDIDDGSIVIPFDTVSNSTLLSVDNEGMFFDIDCRSLYKGRMYVIEFLVIEDSTKTFYDNVAAKFKVDIR